MSDREPVTLLKLGGSVITRKGNPETVDRAALEDAAGAIGAADGGRFILVHGGGSFGHHHADRHGVTQTVGSSEPDALFDVHDAMKRLNASVVDALRAHGVPAAPVHPFSMAERDRDGGLSAQTAHLGTMLAEGFTPVLHGDVVVHRGKGVTVLSGDELVVELARGLDADRIGLCATVPGVLRDGTVIDRIDSFEAVADVLGDSDATDVTGGMAGKVRRLLDLPTPASIFGPEELSAFVAGEFVGTLVGGNEGNGGDGGTDPTDYTDGHI